MTIIGITGTLGAGKGTVVEYLKQHGFEHFSAREFITDEVRRRGIPVSRDTMTPVANDMRAKNGHDFIAIGLYELASKQGGDAVIESLRTPGECKYLKGKGDFVLLAVDADRKLRYQRALSRGSETDDVSFEEFVAHEEREMTSDDPNKQNIAACIKLADYVLINNGTREEFDKQIEDVLNQIKSSKL